MQFRPCLPFSLQAINTENNDSLGQPRKNLSLERLPPLPRTAPSPLPASPCLLEESPCDGLVCTAGISLHTISQPSMSLQL